MISRFIPSAVIVGIAAIGWATFNHIDGQRADALTAETVETITENIDQIGDETPNRFLTSLNLNPYITAGLSITPEGEFCVAAYHDRGNRYTSKHPATFDSAAGGTDRIGGECETSGTYEPTPTAEIDRFELIPTPTADFGGNYYIDRDVSYTYKDPSPIFDNPRIRALYLTDRA